MLDIKDITFERGESGQLLAEEVTLELLEDKPTVKIKPLTRGRINELVKKSASEDNGEADVQFVLEGLEEPKMTVEQIKDLKPKYFGAILAAILAASYNITQKEVGDSTKTLVAQQENELKKK